MSEALHWILPSITWTISCLLAHQCAISVQSTLSSISVGLKSKRALGVLENTLDSATQQQSRINGRTSDLFMAGSGRQKALSPDYLSYQQALLCCINNFSFDQSEESSPSQPVHGRTWVWWEQFLPVHGIVSLTHPDKLKSLHRHLWHPKLSCILRWVLV